MKGILITGCDSGFGYHISKRYMNSDRAVIYTYLENNPFPKQSDSYGIKLDLRNHISITEFEKHLAQIINTFDIQLSTVVNNAGIAMGGPIEDLPLYIYREVMEVNFFGLLAVTKLILPYLIKNKGKLIIHGSMAGRITAPFMTAYASSKHALESIADGLRRELYRDNIQVMLLETGGVNTPIWHKPEKQNNDFIQTKYQDSMNAFMDNFVRPNQSGWPVEEAVKRLYKVIERKRLPKRYRLAKNKIKNFLPLILPSSLLDWIFRKMMRLE